MGTSALDGVTHDGVVHRGTVTHVCRVSQLHDDAGSVGVTAIDKRPVDAAVTVGPYGLYGDVQADRKHHGGPEKALYALDQVEADFWSAELGEAVVPGRFGENLRISGLRVDDAEIGERWHIGETLEVEVTGPRTPCATFGRWLGQDRWVRRFTEHGRTGVYLRVLTPGSVRAGDAVTAVFRPGHGVTASGWFTRQALDDARALVTYEAAGHDDGGASGSGDGDGGASGSGDGDGGAPGSGDGDGGASGLEHRDRGVARGGAGGAWKMARYLRDRVDRVLAQAEVTQV